MSAGIKANADGSAAIQVGGSDAITITSGLAVAIPQTLAVTGAGSVGGNLSFNSGYGSAAVAYGCRAWVNFNGTGTVAIRASGNVSSITDNGTGDYTVNFTTAMPDANYSVAGVSNRLNSGDPGILSTITLSTGSVQIQTGIRSTGSTDNSINTVSIFR
jgi:uncharacterized protein (AIM24 family)